MITIETIKIKKIILHILDTSVEIPVLSEKEHPQNIDVMDFLETHIEKAFNDINIKETYFDSEENMVRNLSNDISKDSNKFVEKTKEFANHMFKIMRENPSIPSCDLICILFEKNNKPYLGFFILTYKSSYIHFIEELEDKRINKVVKHKTTLPNKNQRINEFIIINLQDFSILLKEKKYEINGQREYYLSKHLLKSKDTLSNKEKIDVIDKVSKKIVKDYYEDDVKKIGEIKKAIVESVEETNTIDINYVKNEAFNKNLDLQNIYEEEIKSKGLEEKIIKINEPLYKKIPKTQKLVTDNGIEIKVPVSYLSNKNKIEFITNTDGTISILFKNISNIQGK